MELDGLKIRQSGHDYLAEKLNLPDWYGRNLDALYDCLCEMDIDIELSSPELVDDDIIEIFKDASRENDNLTFKIL